jgi:hypothetical protein
LQLPEEIYVLRSRSSNRRPRNPAQQGCRDILAAEHGMDLPSLIALAVICCFCLLTALWAAFSGCDLGAYLL